ncbi:hypothetical protein HK405_001623, partial [Cladochytrium tenue]
GKTVSVTYRVLLSSAHFAAIFYLLARPTFDMGLLYAVTFMNFYVLYGYSAVVSMLVPRADAPLFATIVAMIAGVLCGYAPQLTPYTSILFDLFGNRWAADTQFGLWVTPYEGVYQVDLSVEAFGYKRGFVARNLLVMVILSVGYRCIAFALMVLLHRDKQR